MKLIIDIHKELYDGIERRDGELETEYVCNQLMKAVDNGTPLTQSVLADALMEERIRGNLDSDTTFEKDIIRDVKCRLTVSIIDHRPCYCGAELREVWGESKDKEGE